MSGGCVCLPTLRFHYVQAAGSVNVVSFYKSSLCKGVLGMCVCVVSVCTRD